jgi:hypothetical protein
MTGSVNFTSIYLDYCLVNDGEKHTSSTSHAHTLTTSGLHASNNKNKKRKL